MPHHHLGPTCATSACGSHSATSDVGPTLARQQVGPTFTTSDVGPTYATSACRSHHPVPCQMWVPQRHVSKWISLFFVSMWVSLVPRHMWVSYLPRHQVGPVCSALSNVSFFDRGVTWTSTSPFGGPMLIPFIMTSVIVKRCY